MVPNWSNSSHHHEFDVIIGQDIGSLANFAWGRLLISYMSIPLFIVLFVYYKIKNKTKLIPLDEIDLSPHRDHRS